MALRMERRRLEARLSVIAEIDKELVGFLTEGIEEPSPPVKIGDVVMRKPSDAFRALSEESGDESTNAKLKEFLLARLAREERDLDDLVHLALQQGFNFGSKSPARVLHFNLLNLKNSGLIEKEGDKWKSIRNQTA